MIPRVPLIILAVFLLLLITASTIFYIVVLRDEQSPTFIQPQSSIANEPMVTRDSNIITVEWSLPEKYEKNEILIQGKNELSARSWAKKTTLTAGSGATVSFDSVTGNYTYKASFDAGQCIKKIADPCNHTSDTYQYQLMSLNGTEGFVSQIYQIETEK